MRRILLTTLNAKYIHMNLAIRLLYGLNKDNEGLEWAEFSIKQPIDEIADACKDFEVVAFSCYIWNITQTLEVAKKLKVLNPSIQILLGGPEVSYDWQETIKRPEVDFIIPGEGEIPFRNFLMHYPNVSEVNNLVYKLGSEVQFNPLAESFDILSLEGLNPYLFEPKEDLSKKVAYIETSRGCPYKCEFCLASLDNKVRYLPMTTIKENLLYLMKHGKVIKFLDRTFNVKKDFTLEIFQFILDNHLPGNVFQFEITADIVHPDIIKFIHEKVPKGLFRFEIGIQTVNQKANLEVSRKQNFDKTSNIIRQLREHVEMHLDLIVGLPFDKWEDIGFSFEEVFKLHPPELQLGFLKFLKGTPVREKYEQYGYVFDPNPPYQIIQSNYLSITELKKIGQLEEALELYWNKGRAPHVMLYLEQLGSLFEILVDLGDFFESQVDFHQHTLDQSFEILSDFCHLRFPQNKVLQELIAIDYYLHFKVKPKTLIMDEEIGSNKQEILEKFGLKSPYSRFKVFNLSFNWNAFSNSQQLVLEPSPLVIEYNGTQKARVVN